MFLVGILTLEDLRKKLTVGRHERIVEQIFREPGTVLCFNENIRFPLELVFLLSLWQGNEPTADI